MKSQKRKWMTMTNYHDKIKQMLEEVPERHAKITKRAMELAKEVESEMTRASEPYVNTKPTVEDRDEIREAVINGDPDAAKKALFVVERFWNEIERLRSIIQKQIY